ncbi:esterase-like activity of phytase family protein [Sulfurimonas lithotrophica]|uniref:Esterase-like activity of phytase family protein n=1 Tax=Sulfurimonas lithotrophica TaxID=2590022 RepID=A0A5P8NYL9_9BACT|nr:esterase-like activity of phytase family protein [Sulfurimonas lithotrophica]QFR48535.1 esterase-like activity of phytase family protein [Sulfurimonas lithotrophica]
MRIFLILLTFTLSLYATHSLKVLDIYEYKNKDIRELSALAYDGNILYALSDYGQLHHFKLDIKNKKIKLSLVKSFKLRNKKNKPLKKKESDAESLVYKDKKLYISFERKHRIDAFTLDGKKIKKLKLNEELLDKDKYKSKNKGLEALAYSEKYGFITAPEAPFIDNGTHILYTVDNSFKIKKNGYITALEFMSKNKLIVLERDFNNLTRRQLITISLVNLKKCNFGKCKKQILKVFDSYKDKNVDNFEGLTKLDNNLFLMVSDDNANFLQKTLFVLFEVD